MTELFARVALGLLWLLHFLPLPLLSRLGSGLGSLLFVVGRSRRRVALTNLALCFPDLSNVERKRIGRDHFRAFARVMLQQGLLWWGSNERFLSLVKMEGIEHWATAKGRPVIWFAQHFVGLEWGGLQISTLGVSAGLYSHQKSALLDRMLLKGRNRFNNPKMFSRQEGIRAVLKVLKQSVPFYYLPDLDYGPRDALFVPFFGVPAATITGLARLSKLANAVVLPMVTRQLPNGEGYVVKIFPAWENYPSDDIVADTARMNAFIEDRVREMPEQYLWSHKRFKTRPPGEARFYD